jgi:hypothetical protein
MSVSAVGSATNDYIQNTAANGSSAKSDTSAANGSSAAANTSESAATKTLEQTNGGKTGSTSSSSQSSNSQVLNQIKMYANQHMSASEIAQRLGISISTVMQQAAAAGVNLNATAASSSAAAAASTSTMKNPDVGNNVDTVA